MSELVQGDARKACCREAANLVVESVTQITLNGRRVDGVSVTAPATDTVRRCRICGCRHFELAVDPLHLRLRASQAG